MTDQEAKALDAAQSAWDEAYEKAYDRFGRKREHEDSCLEIADKARCRAYHAAMLEGQVVISRDDAEDAAYGIGCFLEIASANKTTRWINVDNIHGLVARIRAQLGEGK